ncbi:CrcB family protein [Nocardioides sp. HDW12B]|nr:CrcB family protein [Nocardioides sp. HDW12B]
MLVVALGGATGALLRYALDTWTSEGSSAGFPWTTFGINVVGSFLLGVLPTLPRVRRSPLLAPFLGPGVLGGFTTLSAVSEQTRSLLADERIVTAATYAGGTLVACLLAVVAAERLGRPHRAEEDP